ncbi:hypothetical protein ABKN59_004322 [Abortiporus biennis]
MYLFAFHASYNTLIQPKSSLPPGAVRHFDTPNPQKGAFFEDSLWSHGRPTYTPFGTLTRTGQVHIHIRGVSRKRSSKKELEPSQRSLTKLERCTCVPSRRMTYMPHKARGPSVNSLSKRFLPIPKSHSIQQTNISLLLHHVCRTLGYAHCYNRSSRTGSLTPQATGCISISNFTSSQAILLIPIYLIKFTDERFL